MDMDVMAIANAYSGMRQSQVQMAVQTQMLKASMDIQTQAVQDLLNSVSPEQANIGPAHLGSNIDIRV